MDQSSMKIPIEIRMPFYDEDLLDYTLKAPTSFFFRENRSKNNLRIFLKNTIPEINFDEKTKVGFRSPDYKIIMDNEAEIRDTLYQNKYLNITLPGSFSNISRNESNFIWRMYSLVYWLDNSGVL